MLADRSLTDAVTQNVRRLSGLREQPLDGYWSCKVSLQAIAVVLDTLDLVDGALETVDDHACGVARPHREGDDVVVTIGVVQPLYELRALRARGFHGPFQTRRHQFVELLGRVAHRCVRR